MFEMINLKFKSRISLTIGSNFLFILEIEVKLKWYNVCNGWSWNGKASEARANIKNMVEPGQKHLAYRI